MEIKDVIDALEAKGCQPQETGPDQWKARCPAHEDENPSLSVRLVDGKIRLKCFGPCEDTEVYDVLGLKYTRTTGRTGPKRNKPKTPGPLPAGKNKTHYIYRDRQGQIVGAVVRTDKPHVIKKDGKPDKDFHQYRYVGDGKYIAETFEAPRPLYQLQLVDARRGSVVVVEGEKCAEAAARHWPKKAVVCWPGGTDTWRYADWNPLRGRDVVLVADEDSGGRKAMAGIGNLLHAMDCKVEIVLPAGDTKNDIDDWIKAGTATETIRKLKAPFEPDPEQPSADQIRANQHYRILGLVGNLVAVRLGNGRVEQITRSRLCSPNELISLAPERFWYALRGTESLSPIVARSIGDGLIREADRMGQVNLANVLGRGAARLPDGTVVFHLGDRILRDGKDTDLEKVPGIWQAEPPIAMAAPADSEIVVRARDAILAYRWRDPVDGKRFLGWLAAAVAGGAMDWRPHLLLAGQAGTGKSWLIQHVLERLLGPLLENYDDVTPAAIATDIAGASLPVIIDEAEPTENRAQRLQQIMELFRSASGGGTRARADGRGGVRKERLRFSGMLAMTVSPWMSAPDATRLCQVRFGPPVESWPNVARNIRAALDHADGIRARLITEVGKIADNAREVALEIQSEGKDTRQSLVTAALTAGYWFWCQAEEDEVKGYTESTEADDAIDALMLILGIPIRRAGAPETNLSEMVRTAENATTIAEAYGVKFETGNLYVWTGSKGLQGALAKTAIGRSDLRELLLQIDGAKMHPNPLHFGSYKKRAVIIPANVLAANGIDLNWSEKGQQSAFNE
ncbi:MAG: hypothetical protein F4Y26_05215 [Gammaproteobacteria bacterium]|nr:hypothetical protein [Gammaproteobacteria bacterium]